MTERFRRFQLNRHVDETGVSGTGVVAYGVKFPDGVVAIRWAGKQPSSVVFYDNGIESVTAVNGHGGKTTIDWIDPEKELNVLKIIMDTVDQTVKALEVPRRLEGGRPSSSEVDPRPKEPVNDEGDPQPDPVRSRRVASRRAGMEAETPASATKPPDPTEPRMAGELRIPPDMPAPEGDEYECRECAERVPLRQAVLSFTRFEEILCSDDYQGWGNG